MNKRTHYLSKVRSMTLVELAVVVVIFSVVVVGSFSMFMSGYQNIFRTNARLEVNADIRKATDELVFKGRRASYFLLFDRFDGTMYKEKPDSIPTFVDFRQSKYHGLGDRKSGEYGNFVVFVFTGEKDNPHDPDEKTPIERIVGYTLDSNKIDAKSVYCLRTFDLTFDDPDDRKKNVEELIPPSAGGDQPASNTRVCIPMVRGTMEGVDGQKGYLFRNLDGRSLVMNSQFFYGNPKNNLGYSGLKSASNAYFFTITPRGNS